MIHPCRSQVHTQLHNRHHCQSLLYYDSASSAAIPSRTSNLARLCSTKRHGHRHLEANHGLCGRGLSHSCCPQEREPLPLFFSVQKFFLSTSGYQSQNYHQHQCLLFHCIFIHIGLFFPESLSPVPTSLPLHHCLYEVFTSLAVMSLISVSEPRQIFLGRLRDFAPEADSRQGIQVP